MTIQEALEILINQAQKVPKKWVNPKTQQAIDIAEIMLAEPAFFSAYQIQSVEDELEIQAEEARS